MAGEPGGAPVLGAVMLVCVCWGLPSWHLPMTVASLAEDDARRHPCSGRAGVGEACAGTCFLQSLESCTLSQMK